VTQSPEPRLRTTNTSLKLTQRLRLHGTRSTIRRLLRQQQTAESRLTLLQAEIRHQLLLLKELEQNLQQHQHRILELQPEPNLPQHRQALQWWQPEVDSTPQ